MSDSYIPIKGDDNNSNPKTSYKQPFLHKKTSNTDLLQSNIVNYNVNEGDDKENKSDIKDHNENKNDNNDNKNDGENDNENDDCFEYDPVLSFFAIDFKFVLYLLILGLAIGFIIYEITGTYKWIFIMGTGLSFGALLWSECYREKKPIKILGEELKNLYDEIDSKRPENAEYYSRSDFLDKKGRRRGFTIVYMLADAPNILVVQMHKIGRLSDYKGFEIGAGIVSLLFLSYAIYISITRLADIASQVLNVIINAYFGVIVGASIEIALRKKKIIHPLNLTITTKQCIPANKMGSIRSESIGYTQPYQHSKSDRFLEIIMIYWYQLLVLFYTLAAYLTISFCSILVPRYINKNSILFLWLLITIVLICLFNAHDSKHPDSLIAATAFIWLAFIFGSLIMYRLHLLKCNNKLRIFVIITNIFLLVNAILIIVVTSKLFSLSIEFDSNRFDHLNCVGSYYVFNNKKDINLIKFEQSGKSMCDEDIFRIIVTSIVLLSVVWFALYGASVIISKQPENENPQEDSETPKVLEKMQIKRQWQQYASLVINRWDGEGRAKYNLFSWSFGTSDGLTFPFVIELTKEQCANLHDHLLKKAIFYQFANATLQQYQHQYQYQYQYQYQNQNQEQLQQ